MSTNQEFRHGVFKEKWNPGAAYTNIVEDHISGYNTSGGTAGTYNERRLLWINAEAIPGAPFSNLMDAQAAYGATQGVINWDAWGGDFGPTINRDINFSSGDGTLVTVFFSDKVNAFSDVNLGWQMQIDGGTAETVLAVTLQNDPTDPSARNSAVITVPAAQSPISAGQQIEVSYTLNPGTLRDDVTATFVQTQKGIPVRNLSGTAATSGFGPGFSPLEFS